VKLFPVITCFYAVLPRISAAAFS